VCIVDASGKIVMETKVASESEALVEFFKGLSFPVTRIGLEAGPLSQWLHASLGWVWRQNADHEQKRETGDVTISWGA
jgi:hypothetical protein